MIKRLLILFLVVAAATTINSCAPKQHNEEANEPEETFSFVEGHAPVWDRAIVSVLEIAETMPEEGYSFKPMDSVRTFGEQMIHIAEASVTLSNLFLKDIKPSGNGKDASTMTKAEIMDYVKTSLESVGKTFASMSDQKLMEKTKDFAGNEVSRLEGLLFTHDHLTNHKAKANLYLRMYNLIPPPYKYF